MEQMSRDLLVKQTEWKDGTHSVYKGCKVATVNGKSRLEIAARLDYCHVLLRVYNIGHVQYEGSYEDRPKLAWEKLKSLVKIDSTLKVGIQRIQFKYGGVEYIVRCYAPSYEHINNVRNSKLTSKRPKTIEEQDKERRIKGCMLPSEVVSHVKWITPEYSPELREGYAEYDYVVHVAKNMTVNHVRMSFNASIFDETDGCVVARGTVEQINTLLDRFDRNKAFEYRLKVVEFTYKEHTYILKAAQ